MVLAGKGSSRMVVNTLDGDFTFIGHLEREPIKMLFVGNKDNKDNSSHPLSDMSISLGSLLDEDVHSFSSSISSFLVLEGVARSRVKELAGLERRSDWRCERG